MSPDPYTASGGPSDPGSWNRYAYTEGDPVNGVDPTGEFVQSPCTLWGAISWACSPFAGMWPSPGTSGPGPAYFCMFDPSCMAQFTQQAPSSAALSGLNVTDLSGFMQKAESLTCKGLPDGIVMSVSGNAFAGLGITGSLEVVFNMNTGQISGFGSLGPITGGAGVQGGVSAQTGFIWGLGQSNNSYSGPFTSLNIGAGLITASLAGSSQGWQNPFALSTPAAASIGVQTPGASATYGITYYS